MTIRSLSRPSPTAVVAVALVVLVLLASGGRGYELANLAVAGLGTGAIAALSGVGLVVTYRATGVFNLAQGGVATVAAFAVEELVVHGGVPVALAAVIAVVVVGPALGVLGQLTVFGPLDRRGASTSEKLVANLGALVLALAVCVLAFGEDAVAAPNIFPTTQAFALGTGGHQVSVGWATLGNLGLLAAGAVSLTVLLSRTRLGRQIRAVVDRRGLAELTGISAARISGVSWALGCGFAALTGVLYAPLRGLEAGFLTLTVLQTIAVAVIARLVSIPVAVAAGLGLGVAQSLAGVLSDPRYPSWLPIGAVPVSLTTELLVLATLVFLVLDRRPDAEASGVSGLVTATFGRRQRGGPLGRAVVPVAAGALALLAPLVLSAGHLATAGTVIAYAVAFASIVAVTGLSGHITLATAAFAGLGAYITTRLSNGYLPLPVDTRVPHLPVLLAMLVAAALVVPLGVALGHRALHRRGLILALLTLAFAQVVDALVFQSPSWVGSGLDVHRPAGLGGARAYVWFELAVLALVAVFVLNLRSGALGRALGAMRDSEAGAVSVGLSLRRYKLVVFGAGSALAAVGGALIAGASQSVDFSAAGPFSPLSGLYWFAAVVVCGLSYRSGAVLAAAVFVGVDAVTGQQGASLAVVGLLALVQGRLPGGIVGSLLRLVSPDARVHTSRHRVATSLRRHLAAEQARAATPAPGTGLTPSPLAGAVLARRPTPLAGRAAGAAGATRVAERP